MAPGRAGALETDDGSGPETLTEALVRLVEERYTLHQTEEGTRSSSLGRVPRSSGRSRVDAPTRA